MVHDGWNALGLRVPVVNAPMGGAAGGRLAAAVSAAGGLGMIGMGSAGTCEALQRELALVPPRIRVGIGLVDWVIRRDPALLDIAIEARPALLSVSFGTDFDWVARARAAGIPTITQVADVAEARVAQNAGVDIIVARGLEGGGHGRPLRSRDELLTAVRAVTDRPVLAAGAISSADDVRRVLALGAAGAWVGTAFLATTEALTSPGSRRAVLAAGGDDTIVTSVFDRAAGFPWPTDIPERVLANRFTARWHDPAQPFDAARAAAELRQADQLDDPQDRCVNAGVGVGQIQAELSAAEVVAMLSRGVLT